MYPEVREVHVPKYEHDLNTAVRVLERASFAALLKLQLETVVTKFAYLSNLGA